VAGADSERFPPARDLAVPGVNVNTVFPALRTLREEGPVEFREQVPWELP